MRRNSCIIWVGWTLSHRQFITSFFAGVVENVLAAVAIVGILFARKHYTIDVLLAYFLSTRTFWTYHSLQHSYHLGNWEGNTMNRTIWARFVFYLESDAPTPDNFANSISIYRIAPINRIIHKLLRILLYFY